jgi:Tfp pilus assembly protein PilP
MTRIHLAAALVAASVLTGYAQQPPPPATPPPAVGQPAAPPAPGFTYDPTGRRDPFVSLVGRGSSQEPTGVRPAGVAGMLINEVNLKGIMKERSGFVALIQGPDKKTYAVRPGQRLFDGSVKSITEDAVVFSQDVNDPLSLVKQKDIRKTLRSGEESRG